MCAAPPCGPASHTICPLGHWRLVPGTMGRHRTHAGVVALGAARLKQSVMVKVKGAACRQRTAPHHLHHHQTAASATCGRTITPARGQWHPAMCCARAWVRLRAAGSNRGSSAVQHCRLLCSTRRPVQAGPQQAQRAFSLAAPAYSRAASPAYRGSSRARVDGRRALAARVRERSAPQAAAQQSCCSCWPRTCAARSYAASAASSARTRTSSAVCLAARAEGHGGRAGGRRAGTARLRCQAWPVHWDSCVCTATPPHQTQPPLQPSREQSLPPPPHARGPAGRRPRDGGQRGLCGRGTSARQARQGTKQGSAPWHHRTSPAVSRPASRASPPLALTVCVGGQGAGGRAKGQGRAGWLWVSGRLDLGGRPARPTARPGPQSGPHLSGLASCLLARLHALARLGLGRLAVLGRRLWAGQGCGAGAAGQRVSACRAGCWAKQSHCPAPRPRHTTCLF